MPCPPATPSLVTPPYTQESRDTLPPEVSLLLATADQRGPEWEAAWTAFLETYSHTLLRVATAFAPGYDGALDRYTYMLDELGRHNCRRLRRFAADGRGRFSTWLAVVAKRLCLDHYRRQYGRVRPGRPQDTNCQASRASRRRLTQLCGVDDDVARVEDPAAADPGEELDACERVSALARAVASMPPSDRLMIRLRFEEALSAREIAGRLGLPTAFHVYRRLHVLCERLRAALEPRRSTLGPGSRYRRSPALGLTG